MLKMCGLAEDTHSFACGLLVVLSAFTVNAHHRLKHKKCPLRLKRVQSIQKTKRISWDFLCTLKRRIRYKFPIAAGYDTGSRIKALYSNIKAAEIFSCAPYAKKEQRTI